MRERKRDWPQMAYKYRVYLDECATFSELPETVKQEAFAMRDFWNSLVEAWEESGAAYREILQHSTQVRDLTAARDEAKAVWEHAVSECNKAKVRLRMKQGPELAPFLEARKEKAEELKEAGIRLKEAKEVAKATYKPMLEEHSKQFWARVAELKKESSLHWGNLELVEQGFQACLTRFFRGQGGVPRKKRGPITDISFRHRFTGGGLPASSLFREKGRVWITQEPPAEAYAKGRSDSLKKKLARVPGGFTVAGVPLPLRIMLHRPLPEGAIVKTATLLGERTQRQYYHNDYYQANWRFHVVFSVEVPHEAHTRTTSDTRHAAAIDLGWRVLYENRIRIGFLTDDTGYRRELFLPEHVVRDWRYCQEMQAKASLSIEDVKAQFRESLWYTDKEWQHLPEEYHSLFTALSQSKGPGALWRLLKLEKDGLIPGDRFATWAKQWSGWDRQRQGVHGRLVRSRNHYYCELANSLCRQYHTIAIEKLRLDSLATKETNEIAIELSQQYRQLAGLSFLIADLKQSAGKWKTEISEKDPAYTTTTCSQCGSQIVNTGELHLECPNGHRLDQDENASLNLITAA